MIQLPLWYLMHERPNFFGDRLLTAFRGGRSKLYFTTEIRGSASRFSSGGFEQGREITVAVMRGLVVGDLRAVWQWGASGTSRWEGRVMTGDTIRSTMGWRSIHF